METLLRLSIILAFLVLPTGQLARAQSADPTLTEQQKKKQWHNQALLAKANNAFSFELFHQVINQQDTANVFVSPLSVAMALGMTLNGAQDTTRKQMKAALHLQQMNQQAINKAYAGLLKSLVRDDTSATLKSANSIWVKQDFTIEPSFLDKGARYYDARITSLDFRDPAASKQINHWVSNKTAGHIDRMVPDMISPNTVMYLINTIYFDADWAHAFKKEETEPEQFHLQDSTITVDMMQQEDHLMSYRSDKVILLSLPYENSSISMVLMMPADSTTTIDSFIRESLTRQHFLKWIHKASGAETTLKLPKFTIEYETPMKKVLRKLGIEQAFQKEKADFNKMSSTRELFIDEVKHKTFLEVDEQGTEASAASSAQVNTFLGVHEYRFLTFDRPFALALWDASTWSILFLGKIGYPSR